MREADLLALHERYPDRYPVLLESVSGADALGRHDVLFALPGERLVQLPDGTLTGDAQVAVAGGRFLDALDDWFRLTSPMSVGEVARSAGEGSRRPGEGGAKAPGEAPIFSSGWFLYLGYEL
ncbi:MAG: hypothetical protein OEX15_14900, partial [Gammaproteobacteria bacterium]|nr:hypothetical protein [Gammaproteobacteria bacterium]